MASSFRNVALTWVCFIPKNILTKLTYDVTSKELGLFMVTNTFLLAKKSQAASAWDFLIIVLQLSRIGHLYVCKPRLCGVFLH
jgi:hypothetical protein